MAVFVGEMKTYYARIVWRCATETAELPLVEGRLFLWRLHEKGQRPVHALLRGLKALQFTDVVSPAPRLRCVAAIPKSEASVQIGKARDCVPQRNRRPRRDVLGKPELKCKVVAQPLRRSARIRRSDVVASIFPRIESVRRPENISFRRPGSTQRLCVELRFV
jgi:hypothetical protein